jgi:hypothetical protein
MKTKFSLIILIIALFSTGNIALADSRDENTEVGDQASHELDSIFRPQTTHDLLSYTVDLWHDAKLKGDKRKVREYAAEIDRILVRDIKAGKQLLKMIVREPVVDKEADRGGSENLLEETNQKRLSKEDRQYIEQMVSIISTKEALLDSMRRSTAFSNRYRLLGNYINLLRRELGMSRLKFAHDNEE